MIITGVVVIGESELKSTVCTTEDSTYVWTNGECQNSSGIAQTVAAIDDIDTVANNVQLVLGLIGLVVLVLVFLVVIRTAKKFGSEGA